MNYIQKLNQTENKIKNQHNEDQEVYQLNWGAGNGRPDSLTGLNNSSQIRSSVMT